MVEPEVIAARLAPELGPLEGRPEPLSGGITNRNFRVRMGGEDLVLRLCDPGSEVLGIDRETEEIASRRAAAARVAPPVVAFLPDVPALVTRWLPGGEVDAETLRTPRMLGQVADILRRWHATPELPSAFDVVALVERQRADAAALPASFDQVLALAHRIRAALAGGEHAPVPCHNDLLTANFVFDGPALRLVDWEYAGMNDRFFDLANLAVNNDFGPDDDRALLEAYFGEAPSARRVAALGLMRVVSDLREAMWGAVQQRRSTLDFDYAAYADRHWQRLEGAAADPRIEGWLRDAAPA
jgi:thiamine kinase-like enzyme